MDDDILNDLLELDRPAAASQECRQTASPLDLERSSTTSPTPSTTHVLHTCDIPEQLNRDLYPYQRDGVQWLYKRHCTARGALLADEMGLGKTIQVCAFLGRLYAEKRIHITVIVCPSTLFSFWQETLKKWGQLPDGVVEVVHGGTKARRAARWNRLTYKAPCLLLTSYGVIRQDMSSSSALSTSMLDYVVLDEAHMIKDPSGGAFKSVRQLSARHRVALTGTPLVNSFEDLWSLFQFLDGSTLSSFTETRKAFHAVSATILRGNEKDSSSQEKKASQQELARLQEMIRPFLLRREKAELWGNDTEQGGRAPAAVASEAMPGKRDTVIWVRLSDLQQKQYQLLLLMKPTSKAKAAAASAATTSEVDPLGMDDGVDSTMPFIPPDVATTTPTTPSTPPGGEGEPSVEVEPFALLTLLRQTCQHTWMHLNESAFHAAVQTPSLAPCDDAGDLYSGSSKLAIALQLVQHQVSAGVRSLVFSSSRRLLTLFSLVLDAANVSWVRLDGSTKVDQRMQITEAFNEGETSVCLLSPQVGGIGLTLVGASCVILMEPSWNPAVDSQATDRVYRIGQRKQVDVYRLIACGTVEEKMYRNQIFKLTAAKQSVHCGRAAALQDPEMVLEASRYFTHLQLREMFAPGDFERSVTAEQLEEIQRHTTVCSTAASTAESRRNAFVTTSGLQGLQGVVDVNDNSRLMLTKPHDHSKADAVDELSAMEEASQNSTSAGRKRLRLEPTELEVKGESPVPPPLSPTPPLCASIPVLRPAPH